jgi:hypothetical protein
MAQPIMSLDNDPISKLNFAILPIVIPLNPHTGMIVKENKKDEIGHGPSNQKVGLNAVKEIDPYYISIIREKLKFEISETSD